MALHDDLLEQADHLVSREPKKPRQASLRRAVSAAYYALFHLLVHEGSRRLAPALPSRLRSQVGRGFAHGNMREVCQRFRRFKPSDALAPLITLPLEADLVAVVEAFIALKEARHQADYDVAATYNRIDVLQKLAQARSAFSSWRAVRSRPNATVFLAALLLQRQWR